MSLTMASVRIVSWNCAAAYRKKSGPVDDLDADLILLQEPSWADMIAIGAPHAIWRGSGTRKGVAALASPDAALVLDRSYRDDLPWFLPLRFQGLAILHVWACVIDERRRYIRLIHEALDHYEAFLSSAPSLLIGDLNSHSRFDVRDRTHNHRELVERLATLGLQSLYHWQSGEAMGQESAATYFHTRNRAKPYMFDYAFLHHDLLPGARLTIGDPATFVPLSDHLPLIVDLVVAT